MSKQTKLYDVQWLTRKGGEQLYQARVEAHNLKEARENFERWWRDRSTAHPFHVVARPSHEEFSWIAPYGCEYPDRIKLYGKRIKTVI